MLTYRSAGPGYWATTLLPVALFLRNQIDNERSADLIVGIVVVNSIVLCAFHVFSSSNSISNLLVMIKPANIILCTVGLFYTIVISGEPTSYEMVTYAILYFAFPYIFYNVVRHFPRSFTFGEAIIISQAFTFVFWSAVSNFPFPPEDLSKASEGEIVLIFVQGGFLMVVLATRLLAIAKNPWTFHFTEEFFCIWAKCCLLALAVRLKVVDFWFLYGWVANFFFVSSSRKILFVYCLTLILAAFGVVGWKHYSSGHVNTAYRKYFHFLIVAVYLPGILSDINLLHICSAAVLFILLFLEVTRFLNLTIFRVLPIGEMIDSKVGIFRDEQDEGRLIVTPLYLLAGCSLPIWLIGLKYQSSKLPNEALAAALAGVLSIGIGDTFASIGGSMYGRTRWKGTVKTLEGTMFSILSQVIFLLLLVLSGMCSITIPILICMFIAIVVNALVEGITDQIDNLVLPLVAFNVILGAHFILKLVL